jgi:hypothetical protein
VALLTLLKPLRILTTFRGNPTFLIRVVRYRTESSVYLVGFRIIVLLYIR